MKISKRQLRRIIKEAISGTIGSGDPVIEILDWARAGNRVAIGGKNIWPGLGNRAGLHSYADQLIDEKWAKSGERFTKKINALPAGTEVELTRYQSSASTGKGRWAPAGIVITTGPIANTSGSDVPSPKVMQHIYDVLGIIDGGVRIGPSHVKDVHAAGDGEFFPGKNWTVIMNAGAVYMFPDDANSSEYAAEEGPPGGTYLEPYNIS